MAEAAYQQLEAQPLHTTWHALKGRVAARVPILSWLSTYEGKYLMVDLTAGVSLGTMCLAQTLAHATIATTDPIQGLHESSWCRLSFRKQFEDKLRRYVVCVPLLRTVPHGYFSLFRNTAGLSLAKRFMCADRVKFA